ncbi:LysR substrate-binding domain-containing protein [Streptomyces guryensis]|uniref:LysR substrate-binding domain-containing protein n=1 Tax=Streptomyces guryensis TaxID=2886947 RepID=A0A9Q3Z7E5_9ACTN|nr:LysR substrate-binding domain-containing protein [Streptomyces guryensis]MCD9872205.1 LysR substrate-binding domain-containing protein [Streptomyces guryensis]
MCGSAALRRTPGDPRRPVQAPFIGCFSSGILGLLPGVLRAPAGRLPGVRVDVVEAEPPDLFTALDAGQVDVAPAVDFARAPPHTDDRYDRVDLFTDVLDLVVPAGHRLVGRGPVALRAPARDAWIVGAAHGRCGAVARSVCAAAGFTPDVRHAVNDRGAPAALVEAGRRVALIPRLVRPSYARRRVAVLETEGEPASRNVFAAVRTGAEAVLAAVRDQLLLSGAESITRRPPRTPPPAVPAAAGSPATPPP